MSQKPVKMIFGNLFKLGKPTRFHYTPRYYNGQKGENTYKMKSQYRKDEVGYNYNDFKGNWSEDRKLTRTRSNYIINTRLIIIFLVLFFIFWYLMDFDLSFFKS